MPKATMMAIDAPAGEALRLVELPTPSPGEGQVLIRIAAAGVNRPDLIQRAGLYPPPAGAPQTLGLEVSGWIEGVGPGVSSLREGEPVVALLPGGGYAEYAIAHAGSVMRAPTGIDLVHAAGLPETVMTVWNNVFDISRLQPGETLLVHGGASGIGTTAIQMAKAHGAKVFATAGTDDKCRLCERLGAIRCINYRTEDFESVVKAEGGADVILDMVGAPYLTANLNILKDLGRLCYIAFLQGAKTEVDLSRIMMKRLTVTGSTLRIRTDGYKAQLARSVEANVWPWIASGQFRPVIDCVLPLSEAEAAHARMQGGDHAGKIILSVA